MDAKMDVSDLKVDVPVGKSGEWAVSRYTVTDADEAFQRLRCAMNPHRGPRIVPKGEYTRLIRNGKIIMSDTPDEIQDFLPFVKRASGSCLVAGLGLGVVVHALLLNEYVLNVHVIEKSEDVIRLVKPWLLMQHANWRVVVEQGDIFDFKAELHYDTVWFDIWDDICADNLKEMQKLKRKPYAKEAALCACWCESECKVLK